MNSKTVPFQRRRRQMMAGLALAPWAAGVQAAVAGAAAPAAQGTMWVVSQRGLPASAAFAARLAASGAMAARSFDDPGRLLYGDLAAFWPRRDAVLSGCTDADAYFCIERVALDQGWRAVHLELSPRTDADWIAGSAQTVTALAARPERWQPTSLSWSREARSQWVTWAMVPREHLV